MLTVYMICYVGKKRSIIIIIIAIRRCVCVCGGGGGGGVHAFARVHACARVCVRSFVRDVFAMYDNNL